MRNGRPGCLARAGMQSLIISLARDILAGNDGNFRKTDNRPVAKGLATGECIFD